MNSWATRNLIYSKDFNARVLEKFQSTGTTALMSSVELCLIKDPDFTPDPVTPGSLFPLSEADFTGYARASVTFAGALNLTPLLPGLLASALFTAEVDDPFVQNSIYGYFVDSAEGIVASEKFPSGTSAQMAAPGDFLAMDVLLPNQPYQATS